MALNNYLNSKPQNINPQHSNFALKEVQHNGFNPIHQARVAKDFQMQKPKLQKLQAPMPEPAGSPWLAMAGKA